MTNVGEWDMTLESFNGLIPKLDGWVDAAVLMLPNLGAASLILLGF